MHKQNRHAELFDYLSAPVTPQEAHGVLAFGRKDLLVARKVVDLAGAGHADYAVFTGKIGKDSQDLAARGLTEAEYLAAGAREIARDRHITLPAIHVETEAENGGQNVRNSLALMREKGLPYNAGLISVAHATSLRRLTATITHETAVAGEAIDPLYRVPTDYNFDPSNLADQQEAEDEMWRLIDWPTWGMLQPQDDMPQDLVDFTIDQRSKR